MGFRRMVIDGALVASGAVAIFASLSGIASADSPPGGYPPGTIDRWGYSLAYAWPLWALVVLLLLATGLVALHRSRKRRELSRAFAKKQSKADR